MTAVQLAVADLSTTTTSDPQTRPYPGVYDEITDCATEFAKASTSGTLDETPVPTEDDNRSHVRFIGTSGDMPFFMVQAGRGFFDMDQQEKRNRRPFRVPPSVINLVSAAHLSAISHKEKAQGAKEPPGSQDYERIFRQIRPPATLPPCNIPHALFLSVFLSRASFLPTYVKHLRKTVFHDVKIDVYFNGELCASTYVPERFHSDKHGMTEHIVRFSGRRVHRLLEKPWVILPRGQCPDERPRPSKQNMASQEGAKERWAAVSKALTIEAGKLGRGKNGELSLLADYLSTLAALAMPSELQAIQKAGGPKMGIIDVVVTAGKGQKDDANGMLLMEPTPIRLGEPKRSALEDKGNNKNGRAAQEACVEPDANFHQDVNPHVEEIIAKEGNLPRKNDVVTKKLAMNEPRTFTHSSSPADMATRQLKRRYSLCSRADAEILAQNVTSQARSLRSQHRLVSDPISIENEIRQQPSKPQAEPTGRMQNLRATSFPQNVSSSSPRMGSETPFTPSSVNVTNPRLPSRRPQSLPMNTSLSSSDAKRSSLVHRQTATSNPWDRHAKRYRTPLGTFARAASAQPEQKCVDNDNDCTPAERAPRVRRRLNYEFVLDNKLTLAEEMESIAAEAAQETLKSLPGPAGLNHSSEVDADSPAKLNEQSSTQNKEVGENQESIENHNLAGKSNGSMNEITNDETKSKVVKLKIRAPKPPPQPLKSLPKNPDLPQDPVSSPAYSLPHEFATPRVTSSSNLREQGSNPESRFRYRRQPRSRSPLLRMWTGTAPLSDDAVLTYAPGDMLRQVKGERNGWFREEGVVMGVRFLVG